MPLAPPPLPASRPSYLAPHRMCPPFESAGDGGVQPAAELRHVQGLGHELHGLGALHPCPVCPLCARYLSCATVALRPPKCTSRPTPFVSRIAICCRPHLAPHRMPSVRLSAGRVGVQPAAELRHLQRHEHERHSSPPLHAACAAVVHRFPPPGPQPISHRMPSCRLSAERVGVQPAAELRHLQRHNHVPHVLGALLPVPCSQSAVEPSPARYICVAVASRLPPPGTLCTSSQISYALCLSTRQYTSSLSAANKLLIRCAWASTSAFASAGYGSSWGSGSCPPPPSPSPLPPSPSPLP
eukprot:scaffold65777_cov53-Phaeocystis_antarctica.AAC.1